MTTDSGKKPREIKVAFNSNETVRWATEQIDGHPFAEEGTLFREVLPDPDCPNCERLERDLNHSAYLSDKRAFERDSAERINERVFKENDFLKKQLEICKIAIDQIVNSTMSQFVNATHMSQYFLGLAMEAKTKLQALAEIRKKDE